MDPLTALTRILRDAGQHPKPAEVLAGLEQYGFMVSGSGDAPIDAAGGEGQFGDEAEDPEEDPAGAQSPGPGGVGEPRLAPTGAEKAAKALMKDPAMKQSMY